MRVSHDNIVETSRYDKLPEAGNGGGGKRVFEGVSMSAAEILLNPPSPVPPPTPTPPV